MTPHASPAAKPFKGHGMEGAVAKWYAVQTKKSLDDFKTLARRVAEQLRPESNVLEVAPGPGYFAIELAKLGPYKITGLDISQTFVEIARNNAAKENVAVEFRRGNASAMPFAGESFDFLLCRAAFKNFAQPKEALDEIYRVLRPGGKALVIDLRRDASNASIRQAVNASHLGTLNTIVTKLIFRFMLLKRAYTKSELNRMIAQTQFRAAQITEDPLGFEIALSKPPSPSLTVPLFA
jgi:ubiquinone/menaquinone biosynthesis C-methylase UbiE